MDRLDPRAYALTRLRNLKREFVWDASCGDNWKTELRQRLSAAIGLPNEPKPPLDVRIEATVPCDGYRREAVTYATRDGLRAFAYLLIPDQVTQPVPAVICVPGHGEGVDPLVGVVPEDYQHFFAIECVKRGMVALAIENISFGHRKGSDAGTKQYSCVADSMAALMLGESMIAWRVYDAMVAVDFLETRPEIDKSRLGIMGISGGGTVSFWTSCLDERIKGTVVSGYFNTFFDSILSIEHCVDNFAPGVAKIVEMPDMAALISPRFLFVENGLEDPIFPIDAFRSACQKAEEIYSAASVAENFAFEEFPGDHYFHGKKAIPALQEWLQK